MDFQVAKYINSFGQYTFIDNVSNLVSYIPFLILCFSFILSYILLTEKKNSNLIIFSLVLGVIIQYLIVEVLIKGLLANNFDILFRLRPWLAHPGLINPIGNLLSDSSFPSGHMASTATILTILIYYYKKYWWLALIFLFVMGFSRIHNGMHYPSDVIIGAFLGLLIGLTCIVIMMKLYKHKQTY